jgi:hypothetical protein
MDTADALLQIHRVPGQVKIEQHACELEIDTFAARSRAYQYAGTVYLSKASLGCQLGSMIAAAKHNDALARVRLLNLTRD